MQQVYILFLVLPSFIKRRKTSNYQKNTNRNQNLSFSHKTGGKQQLKDQQTARCLGAIFSQECRDEKEIRLHSVLVHC